MLKNAMRRVLLLAVFSVSLVRGQFTSQIEGTVTDPSKAIIPGATVTLENIQTGVTATAKTSGAGYFRFPTLPASTFNLRVTSSSFRPTEITQINLETGETRTVNVAMEVGSTASTITVARRRRG